MRKNINSIEQNNNINNCKVEKIRNYLYVDHINFIFRKLHLIWSKIMTLRFVFTWYSHFPSLSSQFLSFTPVKDHTTKQDV